MMQQIRPITLSLRAIDTENEPRPAPDTLLLLTTTVGDATTLSVINDTNGNDLILAQTQTTSSRAWAAVRPDRRAISSFSAPP